MLQFRSRLLRGGFFGLILVLFLLLSSCGRRTAPKPMGEVSEKLPLLLTPRSFYRDDKLIIQWNLPQPLVESGNQSSSLKVNSYIIDVFKSSGSCGKCEPEDLGKFIIKNRTFSWTPKSDSKIEFSEVKIDFKPRRYALQLQFGNQRGRLLFYQISYRTEGGKFSGKTKKLYPKRPAGVPTPQIIKLIRIDESIHIGWKKVEEVVRTRFNSEGKQLRMIGHFGINFYQQTSTGDYQLLNSKPYRGNSIDLKAVNLPIFARHVDRFGNESSAIKLSIPIRP